MLRRKIVFSAAITALIVAPTMVSFPTDGWAQIDEMIVTTRKREESIQDIPISVTAFGTQQLQQLGIKDVGDITKFTPGIAFDDGYSSQDTRIVIRGLSPTRGRPNAAFLVDGIDFTGEAVSTAGGGFAVNQRLVDIERVEVVKGPQTALYGRSAFAGAIQYITKDPNMDEFEAEAGFDISDEEQYEVTAAVGGPITDRLGLRINGIWYDEDGFYANSMSEDGKNIGGGDGWGLAAKTVWEATDSLTFKARVAYSEDSIEVGAKARVLVNTSIIIDPSLFRAGGFSPALYPHCSSGVSGTRDNTLTSCLGMPKTFFIGTVPDADELIITNAVDPRTNNDYPGTELETLNVTLVGTWDLDFGTLTSYTGYAHSESEQLFEGNWDALAPNILHTSADGLYSFILPDCGLKNCSPSHQEVDFMNETTLWSQELRFATDFDGPVNFTVGGLYWDEDVDQSENGMTVSPVIFRIADITNTIAFPVAGPAVVALGGRPDRSINSRASEHWSVYGMVEWEINDQFKATLEGRYVEEDVTRLGPQCDVAATEALTGLLGVDIGIDTNGDGEITGSELSATQGFTDGIADVCNAGYRGPSSTPTSIAGGSLPIGTLSAPVTKGLTSEASEAYMTPKLTLEWVPNEDQMWYFSVAKAKKPGGITTLLSGTFFTPSTKHFDKEKLMVYEVGGKTRWLDGRLQVNGAAYFQSYSDKQVDVTAFNPVTESDVGAVQNAGAADIYGIEFDAMWQPDDHWTLTAAYSWIDAEYTDFTVQTGSTTEVAESILNGNGGCLEIIDNVPGFDPDGLGPITPPEANGVQDNTTDLCIVSNNGNKIEDIAEHSFVGSIQYMRPLTFSNMDLDWFVQASTVYSGERFADSNNLVTLDSYWTVDLRAGLTSEQWDLLLYVDNLLNDDTVKSVQGSGSQINTIRQGGFPPGPSGNTIAFLPDPRIIGLRGQVRF